MVFPGKWPVVKATQKSLVTIMKVISLVSGRCPSLTEWVQENLRTYNLEYTNIDKILKICVYMGRVIWLTIGKDRFQGRTVFFFFI